MTCELILKFNSSEKFEMSCILLAKLNLQLFFNRKWSSSFIAKFERKKCETYRFIDLPKGPSPGSSNQGVTF